MKYLIKNTFKNKLLNILISIVLVAIYMYFLQLDATGFIIISAIKNKTDEILHAINVLVIFIILISVSLYFFENKHQPYKFRSVVDALLWSISKIIGGIGGYSDFAPVTIPGRILATILGFMIIAIFALPAGILTAGLIDEIAYRNKISEEKNIIKTLEDAFKYDNLLTYIRAKEKYTIAGPRKYLTMHDISYRLYINESSLLSAIRNQHSFRVKNYLYDKKEHVVVEYFIQNTEYGTLQNRNSDITIVSTHSGDQAFIGHFTSRLAETLNANYISSEVYSAGSMRSSFRLQLRERESYATGNLDDSTIAEKFKNDLKNITKKNSLVIYFLASSPSYNEDIYILNGGEKGQSGFSDKYSTFSNISLLSFWFDETKHSSSKYNLQLGTHENYGNNSKKILGHYLSKILGNETLCIHISTKILNTDDPDIYYGAIRFLVDSIQTLNSRMHK